VVDQIPVLAVDEVGRERRLGQHDFVGNSIEASWGGVAHRDTLSAVA
jgi:hypothetical protein